VRRCDCCVIAKNSTSWLFQHRNRVDVNSVQISVSNSRTVNGAVVIKVSDSIRYLHTASVTDHFSGSGRALGRVCVCLCVRVRTTTFKRNDL